MRRVVGEGVSAVLGKQPEGFVAGIGVVAAVLGQLLPEVMVSEVGVPVVVEERFEWPDAPEAGYFGKRQDGRVDGVDASGEAVASALDAERGAAGDDHLDGGGVDEEFELFRPVLDVLSLVEEDVDGAARVGEGVDVTGRDVVLEPLDDLQDGCSTGLA